MKSGGNSLRTTDILFWSNCFRWLRPTHWIIRWRSFFVRWDHEHQFWRRVRRWRSFRIKRRQSDTHVDAISSTDVTASIFTLVQVVTVTPSITAIYCNCTQKTRQLNIADFAPMQTVSNSMVAQSHTLKICDHLLQHCTHISTANVMQDPICKKASLQNQEYIPYALSSRGPNHGKQQVMSTENLVKYGHVQTDRHTDSITSHCYQGQSN